MFRKKIKPLFEIKQGSSYPWTSGSLGGFIGSTLPILVREENLTSAALIFLVLRLVLGVIGLFSILVGFSSLRGVLKFPQPWDIIVARWCVLLGWVSCLSQGLLRIFNG